MIRSFSKLLASALLLLFGQMATATITLSSSGSNTGTTTSSVSSLTVTAGQLITVVVPMVYTSAQTPAAGDLTKDAGSATIGTPTLDKYIVFDSGNSPYYIGMAYYSVLVTGSGSIAVRVTPTGSSAVMAAHVSIWDGTWDASRVENAPTIASSATDNQTSFPSASATSAGPALFLSGLALLQTVNNTITKDAAFTLLTQYQDGTTQMVGGSSYKIVTTGTSTTSTYTAAVGTNYGWASPLVVYKEVSASPAVLSSPTPSGTIGTSTSATIGATTNQNSGTLYTVLSTTNNVATATATQIKAGQNSTGAAAAFSGNNSVSTTSPSVGISGLSASTLYYYAEVQNNTNGDSNVVSGSFTTASASSTSAQIILQLSN